MTDSQKEIKEVPVEDVAPAVSAPTPAVAVAVEEDEDIPEAEVEVLEAKVEVPEGRPKRTPKRKGAPSEVVPANSDSDDESVKGTWVFGLACFILCVFGSNFTHFFVSWW
jgi:hypothetical protein